MAAPQRTVVEVVAKRGGFGQAVLFLVTLGFVACAFFVGILFGAVAALAPQQGSGLPLEDALRDGSNSHVAIISLNGAITNASSDAVKRAVEHVMSDSKFQAVVLRVDSPGGAVSPSDRIWRDIERLGKSGLPVVASYGGIAASGGVYVSCGADHIVCEPTAITGSVGVIASVLTFGGLMEKVGVQPVTLVASGSPRKDDANDPYRPWEESDRAVVQSMLDRSYNIFVDRVMTGRGGKAGDAEALRAALDGRVFGAQEAKDIGLVDSIGYLDDAIAEAERQAGLPVGSATVVRLYEPAPLFGNGLLGVSEESRRGAVGELLSFLAGSRSAEATNGAAAEFDVERVRALLSELSRPQIEYRAHY